MENNYIDSYCEKNKIILSALFEITNKCNLRCKHCYLPEKDIFLSKEKIFEIIDKLYREGTIYLTLTGGEVLTYPNFKEIYVYLKKKGFILEVKTNGLLINDEFIELFKKYPPEQISITLYGLSNREYSNFTGCKDGFERIDKVLDRLDEHEIEYGISIVATNFNYNDILTGKYLNYVKSKGFESLEFDSNILDGIDGNKNPFKFRLTPSKRANLEISNTADYIEVRNDYVKLKNKIKTEFKCLGGISKIYINPQGDAACCLHDKFKINIIDNDFNVVKKGLENRNKKIMQEFLESKCSTCSSFLRCKRCPIKMKRNNLEENCLLAKERLSMIENTEILYELKNIKNIDLEEKVYEFSVSNFGISNEEAVNTDGVYNSMVMYGFRKASIEGFIGKSTFYIPALDDESTEVLGIQKGNGIKIFKNLDSNNFEEELKHIEKMIEINNLLNEINLAPKIYKTYIIVNKLEMKIFHKTKYIKYPENSKFIAIEVEHLNSISNEEVMKFNGKKYGSDEIEEIVNKFLGEKGFKPKDLWIGNMINTDEGIKLIDFYDWV